MASGQRLSSLAAAMVLLIVAAQSAADTPSGPSATASNDPVLCPNATDVKGTQGIYCIGSDLIEPDSYCLRHSGHYPLHIRRMKSAAAMTTMTADGQVGSATFELRKDPTNNNPCYDGMPVEFGDEGDHISIFPNDKSGLTLTIFDDNSKPPFSKAKVSVDLKPDPMGGAYYWTGTQNFIDYFIFLADDQHGQMRRNSKSGVARIEKFIRIEVYKEGASAKCAADRPDVGATPQSIPQVSKWESGKNTCDISTNDQQHGTGGGGQNFP